MKTLLPVRARLHAKWEENQNQVPTAASYSSASSTASIFTNVGAAAPSAPFSFSNYSSSSSVAGSSTISKTVLNKTQNVDTAVITSTWAKKKSSSGQHVNVNASLAGNNRTAIGSANNSKINVPRVGIGDRGTTELNTTSSSGE